MNNTSEKEKSQSACDADELIMALCLEEWYVSTSVVSDDGGALLLVKVLADYPRDWLGRVPRLQTKICFMVDRLAAAVEVA